MIVVGTKDAILHSKLTSARLVLPRAARMLHRRGYRISTTYRQHADHVRSTSPIPAAVPIKGGAGIDPFLLNTRIVALCFSSVPDHVAPYVSP